VRQMIRGGTEIVLVYVKHGPRKGTRVAVSRTKNGFNDRVLMLEANCIHIT
jgi:hypothetical protein